MGLILQDLRQSLRNLARAPVFTLVVLAILAVSIGANSAIYSIVNGMLLRPYPYHDPDRLVALWSVHRQTGSRGGPLAFTDFAYLQSATEAFAGIAVHQSLAMDVADGSEAVRVEGSRCSANLFSVLGIEPLLGRGLQASDGRPDSPKVVVLGEKLWREQFAASREIVGRKLVVAGEPRVVVGVMPWIADIPSKSRLWVPLALDPEHESPLTTYLTGLARLRPGVSLEQAQADLDVRVAGLPARYAKTPAGRSFEVAELREERIGAMRPVFFILLGLVLFVLLIACANLSNLMLVRNEQRLQEVAIRAALGAGRSAILRQLLLESLLLGLAGGVLGLLLGWWGVHRLLALVPVEIPAWVRFDLDGRVLGLTLGVALLAMLGAGGIPAWKATRADVNRVLQSSGNQLGKGRRRLHSLVVVFEVMLSLVLLVGAGLMVRSFVQLRAVDPGFRTENLLTFEIDLLPEQCPICEQRLLLFDALMERYRALPAVSAVGAISDLPLSLSGRTTDFTVLGQDREAYRNNPVAVYQAVGGDYFQAMKIPLIHGQLFSDGVVRSPFSEDSAWISQEMARRLWPGEDPVGKLIKTGPPGDDSSPWLTVRGVVGDTRHFGLDKGANPTLYVPYRQSQRVKVSFVVATRISPVELVTALRGATHEVLPNQAIYAVMPLEELVDRSIWMPRLFTLLFWIFAAIALVLAGGGLYGMMSYLVSRRTSEIGIRMALGARRGQILRMVIRQGLLLTLLGLVLGLPLSLALSQTMAGLLFGISPADLVTYVSLSLLLASLALVATYIPARQATRIDPMKALRCE